MEIEFAECQQLGCEEKATWELYTLLTYNLYCDTHKPLGIKHGWELRHSPEGVMKTESFIHRRG